MAVAEWGSRSPCTEGQHDDFLTLHSEMVIQLMSLRVKQLDLMDPAPTGANDPAYQQMIRHIERLIGRLRTQNHNRRPTIL